MTEIQAMTLSLLLFIAYRIVNPANKRDMAALNRYKDYLDAIVRTEAEGEQRESWLRGEGDAE